MAIKITDYNVICNLGNDINEVFKNALDGNCSCFEENLDLIKNKKVRVGKVKTKLASISNKDYDLRCNKLILKCLEKIDIEGLIKKYGKENIGIVVATTNTGVNEYEKTKNIEHTKISNPGSFIKDYYGLNGYFASVSTACSSGIKAFSMAVDLLENGFMDCFIVIGVDELSKLPLYGFDSLEILDKNQTNPFSKNRNGINISEGAACFILEKDSKEGIEILGIGETTDYYHSTTPDPDAIEAIEAIKKALNQAKLASEDIDYINLHGTGTNSNDLMEARAIYEIFKNKVKASSTKPMTGHCLGASASIEIALCLKLLETKKTKLFPHIFDNDYDENIKKINLVKKEDDEKEVKNILSTSFGFGGTNTAIIIGEGQ